MRVRTRSWPFVTLIVGTLSSGCVTASPTSPSSCTYRLSSSTLSVSPAAGPATLMVTTDSTCTWTIVSHAPFINLTSANSQRGPADASFAIAENIGPARSGTVTIAGQTLTVNQGAAAAALEWNPASAPPATVGAAYTFTFTAPTGAIDPVRYQLDSGTGFLPSGLTLNASGSITGTPVQTGSASVSICVVDAGDRRVCKLFTFVVNGASSDDRVLGNWTGTITLIRGCVPSLPLTYPWTGTIRNGGTTGTEMVITVPGIALTGRVIPVTISGNTISFSVPFDSLYTFTGTLSSDRRSIPTASFTGANCAPPPATIIPSGTWTAVHQ